MGERIYTEAEYRDAIVSAQAEASKLMIQVFDEAYSLGKRHAEAVFGTKGENEQN